MIRGLAKCERSNVPSKGHRFVVDERIHRTVKRIRYVRDINVSQVGQAYRVSLRHRSVFFEIEDPSEIASRMYFPSVFRTKARLTSGFLRQKARWKTCADESNTIILYLHSENQVA